MAIPNVMSEIQRLRAERNYQEALAQVARQQAEQRAYSFGIGPSGLQNTSANLYLQQHFPGYASSMTTQIGKNIYAPRIGGRRHGGYGDSTAAPEGYYPRTVAIGTEPAPVDVVPRQAVFARPSSALAWSGPLSASDVAEEQAKVGTLATPLETPGYMPTSAGYYYSGTKGGFDDELAYRDWLLEQGIGKEELADYGAPAVYD